MQSPMLEPRIGECALDLLTRGGLPVGLTEHLRDDEGEHISRPAEPIDASRLDREIESPAPALTTGLDLDQRVQVIHLVLGIVLGSARAAARGLRVIQPIEVEREI